MQEKCFAVTVTLKGVTSKDSKDNLERSRLLKRVVRTILKHPYRVLVVLLPGGYFRLENTYLGHLNFTARKHEIERAPFVKALRVAATQLDSHAPGSLLVLGVDSALKGNKGDQMCVAWGVAGVKGIGRKIFPVKGPEAENLEIASWDFAASQRVVTLANRQRFMLCACYDGFGVSDPEKRSRVIKKWLGRDRQLATRGNAWRGELKQARTKALIDWKDLCESVDGTLIAIHHFNGGKGQNSTMWQRHGIATASAKLHGGDAFAAAHFESGLPDCQTQFLASKYVNSTHLSLGKRRKAEYARPTECYVDERNGLFKLLWFPLQGPRCRQDEACVTR